MAKWPGAPFIHPRELLTHMPSITATEEQIARLTHGQSANLPEYGIAKLVKVFRGQDDLICIAERIAGTLFKPKVVL